MIIFQQFLSSCMGTGKVLVTGHFLEGRRAWKWVTWGDAVKSLTRKETNYRDQTGDLFNIPPPHKAQYTKKKFRRLSIQPGLIFLQRLALQEKNLITAHVLMLKSRALPDMLPFSLCNKKRLVIWHMNRSLSPTTLSILSYNIGK